MPSKLPVIRANTTNDNITKMKCIAKYNKRSLAKELEYIIEKHINEFEAEHGEIKIEWMSPQEIAKDIGDRISGNPPYEKNNTVQNIARAITGISTGEKAGDMVIEHGKKGKVQDK